MLTWTTRLFAVALTLAVSTTAQAGLVKKLVVGGAVVAVGAAAYAKHVQRKEDGLMHTESHDEQSRAAARLAFVMGNAQDVTPNGLSAKVASGLCGPAAIFATLRGTEHMPAPTKFVDYVNELLDADLLHGLQLGMKPWEVATALDKLNLPSEMRAVKTYRSAASDIVLAVDEGKAVFVVVEAAESFRAITGRPFPGTNSTHIVSPLAVSRDVTGKPTAVALYDVNVYNGTMGQMSGMPMRYIPYDTFVSLLKFGAPRYVVSKEPVNFPH